MNKEQLKSAMQDIKVIDGIIIYPKSILHLFEIAQELHEQAYHYKCYEDFIVTSKEAFQFLTRKCYIDESV